MPAATHEGNGEGHGNIVRLVPKLHREARKPHAPESTGVRAKLFAVQSIRAFLRIARETHPWFALAATVLRAASACAIVEDGSHQELLSRNGLYAELFSLQAEGYS